MAKLKGDAIQSQDIIEYCDTASDFGFELKVLSQLTTLDIDAEHGGTYTDPATNKPRQFDIRAAISKVGTKIRMAVECKNLRQNSPLAVLTVPRTKSESYYDVICSRVNENIVPFAGSTLPKYCYRVRLDYQGGIYQEGGQVGKSCAQVGRLLNDSSVTGGDSEVYDKWSQAIASAHDLAAFAEEDFRLEVGRVCSTFVVPILIVPNDRLWAVEHDEKGKRTYNPYQIDRVPFYIGRDIQSADRLHGTNFTISHLEIVTENGLQTLCKNWLDGKNKFPMPT